MSTIDASLPVSPATYDIVCLGEVLVEVATQAPFGHDVHVVLGISGDPLNVATSAAAAGARSVWSPWSPTTSSAMPSPRGSPGSASVLIIFRPM